MRGLGSPASTRVSWRAGACWQVAPEVTLGLEGTRTEAAEGAPEQGLMLRGAIRW